MNARLLSAFLFAFLVSPAISTQSIEESIGESIEGLSQSLRNIFREKPLFQKYADSAVNYNSLVERQEIKYQSNSFNPSKRILAKQEFEVEKPSYIIDRNKCNVFENDRSSECVGPQKAYQPKDKLDEYIIKGVTYLSLIHI